MRSVVNCLNHYPYFRLSNLHSETDRNRLLHTRGPSVPVDPVAIPARLNSLMPAKQQVRVGAGVGYGDGGTQNGSAQDRRKNNDYADCNCSPWQ